MAVFSSISSFLVGVGLNIFGATAAGWAAATAFANIAIGAALVGASALFSAATSRPSIKTPQAQAVLNQSTGPRIRGYGRALLGGTRAFWDSKDGHLYQIVMMHSGEIDAVESYFVGDRAVGIDGNGDVTTYPLWYGEYGPFVRILSHLGTSSQAANSMMTGAWTQWTSDHRLRGIAYFVSRFKSPADRNFQTIFPEGHTTPIRALCRLTKVHDPRTGSTSWSDNPALAILDYLTSPDGMRLSLSDCDLDSFADFADICDEAVPLAAGGTEKRYRLWGIYQLTDEPNAVLNQMRRTCDAEFYNTAEGKIGIRGGEWQAPTVTITEDHILGHSMEQGNNRFAAFNELKITYTSPRHDYQTMEATAWIDTADQAERGVIASDLDLDFVPSATQARRLAKIHISKSNPRWRGRVRCSLAALDAWGERTVRLIIPELQIDDAFYVSRIELASDLTSMEIEVVTINEAAYQWTTAEEGQNPAIPQETAPDIDFPVPQGAVLSEDAETPGLLIGTVDSPGRDDLVLEGQIRLGAGGLWFNMQTESQTEAVYQTSSDGDYQARFRWAGPSSTVGEWSSPLAEITLPVPAP